MNDFTKEELKLIRTGMRCVVTFVAVKDDYITANNLLDKIQAMIDNYCEHIWTDGGGTHIHCAKCHIEGGKR